MSDHGITLVFEDGRTASLRAAPHETVYGAALRAGVRLQSDCLEGACATCKARCLQGEFSLEDYSDEALSAGEARERYVLACRMKAKSDCVLEFAYESALALRNHPPQSCSAQVAAVEAVGSGVYRLDIDPGQAPRFAYLPGQYAHLAVPGTEATRDYSFANPPGDPAPYSFYVKVLERGAMSEYVARRARPGDAVKITGPFGQFYLRPVLRPVVMVAGGTGLAPMLAMLEHAARLGGVAHPIRLLYGVNRPDEAFAGAQLEALAKRLPLVVERAAVAPQEGWSGASGHVTALLRDELVNGGDCDAYLCGPPPMIDAASRWLQERGVQPPRIHAERFLPS
jgi:NAD(P)H-flavin reductase/ferredoxin